MGRSALHVDRSSARAHASAAVSPVSRTIWHDLSNDMPRKICEGEENRKEGKTFSQFSWKISRKMCIKLVRGSFWKKSKTNFAHCRPLPACQISRRSVQKWRLHNFFFVFLHGPPMETIYIKIVGKRRAAESDYNSFTYILICFGSQVPIENLSLNIQGKERVAPKQTTHNEQPTNYSAQHSCEVRTLWTLSLAWTLWT